MVYRMIFNQTAYFGRGAIGGIPNVAGSHGFTKAFVVTDPILLKTGTVKKVTDVLDKAGMPYELFDNVKPNPPVECIQDGVKKFAASGADFLIGLGGGSPQDTCKGIGIEDAYTGELETVREQAVRAVRELTVKLGNPTKISEAGATEADLKPLARDAFHDVCTPGNPRKATEEAILRIYTSPM